MRTLWTIGLSTLLVTLLVGLRARSVLGQAPASAETQTLHVLAGKAVVVSLGARLKRVMVSNPAVIDEFTTTPTQIVVTGKAAGSSSLILWDEAGSNRMLDVLVDNDVSSLRDAIQLAYPSEHVQIEAEQDRVILSGAVSAPEVADNLSKMAGLYSKTVVNSLNVVEPPHDRQILLEVKFAEVDRSKTDQMGWNLISTGAAGNIGAVSTQQFGAPSSTGFITGVIGGHLTGSSSTFALSDLLNIFLFRTDINLAATIKLLQAKSILQILAEPNLMALNGRPARFLAGGEFPFPVVQGGTNFTAVTIQFRPFGVRLEFTGNIKGDVVRMKVSPEVSTLDFSNALTIAGFVVPAISTRRAETEIELKDGQSFGIAGLLDDRTTVQLNKIPGIGDVPILGELFRSRSQVRSHQELLVLVTPHIVDPVRVATPVPPAPVPPAPFLNKQKFDEQIPQGEGTAKPAGQKPPVR
jgi:pilus assembly protein CpaC